MLWKELRIKGIMEQGMATETAKVGSGVGTDPTRMGRIDQTGADLMALMGLTGLMGIATTAGTADGTEGMEEGPVEDTETMAEDGAEGAGMEEVEDTGEGTIIADVVTVANLDISARDCQAQEKQGGRYRQQTSDGAESPGVVVKLPKEVEESLGTMTLWFRNNVEEKKQKEEQKKMEEEKKEERAGGGDKERDTETN
ncbi:hypothetical protein CBR_g54523 [Chara braunii]|uniref:Uncharacterized protein n=1 Tax=Chara braunii TaxID=69332 RepID=A0A388MC84_CHABU|nr:hypothetical protein CBR_g54523 [Chara braunii]|eukprot:GBG92171.1 hypothetical protein CBR_g54523 [Chara braunii]